jgi:hypothetical protein
MSFVNAELKTIKNSQLVQTTDLDDEIRHVKCKRNMN